MFFSILLIIMIKNAKLFCLSKKRLGDFFLKYYSRGKEKVFVSNNTNPFVSIHFVLHCQDKCNKITECVGGLHEVQPSGCFRMKYSPLAFITECCCSCATVTAARLGDVISPPSAYLWAPGISGRASEEEIPSVYPRGGSATHAARCE